MTIDAAELSLITSGQTKLSELKTTADTLVSKAWAMYLIHRNAGRAVAANNAYGSWGKLKVWRDQLDVLHSELTRDLIMQYGAADMGPIIAGPGGR